DHLTVKRNPNYWQKDANGVQLPYLDKITFKPVADAGQRVASLEGGSLDVIHTSDGIQVDNLLKDKAKFSEMYEKPGHRRLRHLLRNAAKPPLNDPIARKAVALAIDRNQINQLRNDGIFTVASGPFDSSVLGYLKNPGFPNTNVAQAKKLADQYK